MEYVGWLLVLLPSMHRRCWLGGRKGIRPVKKLNGGVPAWIHICLERGADLHTAQLMPLPLTVSCFSKIQIGSTFLVPAHPGSRGQRAVCVLACAIGRVPRQADQVPEPVREPAVQPVRRVGRRRRVRALHRPSVDAGLRRRRHGPRSLGAGIARQQRRAVHRRRAAPAAGRRRRGRAAVVELRGRR